MPPLMRLCRFMFLPRRSMNDSARAAARSFRTSCSRQCATSSAAMWRRSLRECDDVLSAYRERRNHRQHADCCVGYGSNDLDASLLIMPLVFFMGPNDPRMLSTIAAILQIPSRGGLVSD